MDRYLAIDYGTKRVGLALTDPLKMIAQPLLVLMLPPPTVAPSPLLVLA